MRSSAAAFGAVICLVVLLAACGGSGGSGGSSGANPPSAYTIASSDLTFNVTNQSDGGSFSVSVGNSSGASYRWTLSDSAGGEISGNGSFSGATLVESGFDVSALADGPLELSFTASNEFGDGPTLLEQGVKDTVAPSGYVISFSDSQIDDNNVESLVVNLSALTLNTSYNVVIANDENDEEILFSGTASSESIQIPTVNIGNIGNGNIRAALKLTDSAGNEGQTVESFADLDISLTSVRVAGQVTYDYVPHTAFGALDYANTEIRPARGVNVDLLDASGIVVDQKSTDEQGRYSFLVLPDMNVRVRVYARITESETATYDFSVTDNTNGNALYAMQGALASSGTQDSTRDLHAPSGWDGSEYSSTRVAGPFAIIDTVYSALQPILTADPDLQLVPLELRWSTNNRAAPGNNADGDIETSKYVPDEQVIYLLGSADNDTDEYDAHIVAHEFAHYMDFVLSRSDSIGGRHRQVDALDMRLAFSEGFANAFSAMILNDPLYRDSLGIGQMNGIVVDVEDGQLRGQAGWFSQESVQQLLYQFYGGQQSAFDYIYNTLTSDAYKQLEAMTSIHAFLATMKTRYPQTVTSVDALAAAQSITVNDIWGTGETNNGGNASALPLYTTLDTDAGDVEICSNNVYGKKNKLANRRFLRVDIPSTGVYNVSASLSSGVAPADPDIHVFRRGISVYLSQEEDNNIEAFLVNLASGTHVLEVYEYSNVDDNESTGGSYCFDVSVSRN